MAAIMAIKKETMFYEIAEPAGLDPGQLTEMQSRQPDNCFSWQCFLFGHRSHYQENGSGWLYCRRCGARQELEGWRTAGWLVKPGRAVRAWWRMRQIRRMISAPEPPGDDLPF
jgi:hypothetical protein